MIVRESISFERGIDPKKSMGIGMDVNQRSPNSLFKKGVEYEQLPLIKKAMEKARGYNIDKIVNSTVNRYNNFGVKDPHLDTFIIGIGPLENREIDKAIELAYEKGDKELINLFWEKTDLFLVEYLIQNNKQEELIRIIKNKNYNLSFMLRNLLRNPFPEIDLYPSFLAFNDSHPVKLGFIKEKDLRKSIFSSIPSTDMTITVDNEILFRGNYFSDSWYLWQFVNPKIAWFLCQDILDELKNPENLQVIKKFLPEEIFEKLQNLK